MLHLSLGTGVKLSLPNFLDFVFLGGGAVVQELIRKKAQFKSSFLSYIHV